MSSNFNRFNNCKLCNSKNLKDVFLLGFQLDPAKEGMGFGLSEVKRTVEGLHKGRLDVESVVGKGSTFTIHLPCAD